jgi:hypothetical protein
MTKPLPQEELGQQHGLGSRVLVDAYEECLVHVPSNDPVDRMENEPSVAPL